MGRLSLGEGELLTAGTKTAILPCATRKGKGSAVPVPVLVQGACTRQGRTSTASGRSRKPTSPTTRALSAQVRSGPTSVILVPRARMFCIQTTKLACRVRSTSSRIPCCAIRSPCALVPGPCKAFSPVVPVLDCNCAFATTLFLPYRLRLLVLREATLLREGALAEPVLVRARPATCGGRPRVQVGILGGGAVTGPGTLASAIRAGSRGTVHSKRFPLNFVPCTVRKTIAVLLRSMSGARPQADSTSRKGVHGVPVPRPVSEEADEDGAGVPGVPTEGSGDLGRVVATERARPVLDVGKVGPGAGTTTTPAGSVRAARAAVAVVAQVARPRPTVPTRRPSAVAGVPDCMPLKSQARGQVRAVRSATCALLSPSQPAREPCSILLRRRTTSWCSSGA